MTFCYFIDAWIGAQAVLGTNQVTSCKSMFIITMDLSFLTWEIISRTLPTLDCVFLKAEAVIKSGGVRVGVCFPLAVIFLPQRWVFGLMHVCCYPPFC